jgi:transcriptional regulator with XRE-family HTH domain
MARNAWGALSPLNNTVKSDTSSCTKKQFAARLFSLMTKMDWNQSDLARHAGIGRDSVSTYIRGISFPDPKNFHRLCAALGCETADLLPHAPAEDRPTDTFEIRRSERDPSMVHLYVSLEVSAELAAQVLVLLEVKHGE